MKKLNYLILPIIISTAVYVFMIAGCGQKHSELTGENDKYDGPDKAMEFEIERTKDPATGRVPMHKMLEAIMQTEQAKNDLRNSPTTITALSWQERGPNGDFTVGGNPRPAGQQTSGRIRALMVDSTDPTHKTVWAGGVDGGLWKTTDITVSPSPWQLVNDFISNLAVSAICQDPRPGFHNIMYFCTGESFRNADGVRGVGAFKSIDGGVTWNYLASTSAFVLCSRILCDFQGNVYLATRNSAGAPGGLYRSTNGGTNWTDITPTGVSPSICDLEISSTSAPGRLHMTTGIGTAQTYRYTDIPATVSSGSGWNAPATAFPSFNERCEMACRGNVLYALPCDPSNYNVPFIYTSTDGGANWAATAGQPPSGWASGQGWYALSCGINPANTNECIVGGLDCYKTTNGGASWTKISSWATSTTGFYVHADQHNIQWWDGGTKLLFACDGGVHFSTDGGINNSDRNKGLRLKQFYSVAIHPTQTNYFIAGAQDNGMHRMNHPGLDSSAEVVGGDGCYSAIDQNEPLFQYGSYVYNVYRRSTNGGASWSTPVNIQNTGRFVNPWDLDNNTNIIYACNTAGNYLRWDDPHTGGTTTVIPVAAFGSGNVSAVHASPYTPHRVFFGMGSGTLFMVDNANTASPTATNITPAGSSGYLNCVVTGSSDQNLIATYSSYGVMNVWVSTNGGTTWTGIDGNLPDMPVRWALFHPDTDTKAYIATETGVWETDQINGASTVWNPNPGFPTVRTDMIKYRSSDRTIAAGTHGRGIWSAVIPASSGFTLNAPAPAPASCPAPASMQTTLTASFNGGFSNPVTLSATGNPAGTTVVFGTNPLTPLSPSTTVTLTGTNTLSFGSYTIIVTGVASGAPNQTQNITYTINPGTGPTINTHPASQTLCQGGTVTFTVAATGALTYQWQKSTDGGATWPPIAGATGTSYTIVNVQPTDAAQYRCAASGQCGTTNSNAAVLTVNTPPVITAHPQSVTLCTGTSNTFSVTATGTGLTYAWEYAVNCGAAWLPVVPAVNSPTLTVTAVSTNAYRCIVSGTCSPPAISNSACMTVVNSVTITTQPSNSTVCEGGNTSFTAGGAGGGLTYQWQLSTNGGATWGDISGATNATYNVIGATFAMNNYQYRCVISNGVCPSPGITNAAVLTVNRLAAITSQPTDVTLCSGSSNTFCVTAIGTNLTYQWESAPNCGGPWSNVAGGTSSCLTINGVSTASYRCRVTSTACGNTVTSNCATYTVINPVTVSAQPSNAEVCSGSNATFTVAGNSVQPIIYQWQVSTDGGANWNALSNVAPYAGVTTTTLTITGATTAISTYRYRCLLSNATCTVPTVSGAGILTVRQLPTVGLSAAPLTALLPGQTTTLTATPSASTGGVLTTNWFFNTGAISNAGNTRVVNVEQVGTYQVRIQETWPGSLVCSNQSPVVTITATPSPKLFIFPSPNDGRFTVAYYNNGGASTKRTITIFDSEGSFVYQAKFDITGAYTLIPIDLRKHSTGIDVVVIYDQNGIKLAEGKVHVR